LVNVTESLIFNIILFGVVLIVTAAVDRVYVLVARRTLARASGSALFQATGFGSWIIWTVGIIIALSQIGLQTNVLLLILGLGIFALIIGSRDILASWVAGHILMSYKPFKLGDWIRLGQFYGRVVRIEDVSTTIVTPTNEKVTIPNSMITRSAIVNRTNPEGLKVSIPIEVLYQKDLHAVVESMVKVGHALRDELVPETSPEVRVTRVTDRTVTLELILHVVNPSKDEMLRSEAMKMIKKEIDQPRVRSPSRAR